MYLALSLFPWDLAVICILIVQYCILFLQLYKPLSDFIPPPSRVRIIPQNVHNSVITPDFYSLSGVSASPRHALGEDGAFRVIANVVYEQMG